MQVCPSKRNKGIAAFFLKCLIKPSINLLILSINQYTTDKTSGRVTKFMAIHTCTVIKSSLPFQTDLTIHKTWQPSAGGQSLGNHVPGQAPKTCQEVVKADHDRSILQLLRAAILHRCTFLLRLDRNTPASVKQLLAALNNPFQTQMNTQLPRTCGIGGYFTKSNLAKEKEDGKVIN